MTVETTPAALMSEEQVVDVLNGLVESAKDGEAGFAWCAEHGADAALRGLCVRRAAEAAAAARELQDLVVAHGGQAEDHGTVSGALRRGWVTVLSGLQASDDLQMLTACLRASESALERYRAALRKDLPLTVLALVQRLSEIEQRGQDDLQQMTARLRAVAH
jgi:uncharacterized protein (TIGR02284 family)